MEPKNNGLKTWFVEEWQTRHLITPLPITSNEPPNWIEPREWKREGCDCE